MTKYEGTRFPNQPGQEVNLGFHVGGGENIYSIEQGREILRATEDALVAAEQNKSLAPPTPIEIPGLSAELISSMRRSYLEEAA